MRSRSFLPAAATISTSLRAGCWKRLFTPCYPLCNLPRRGRTEGKQPVFTQGVENQEPIAFHDLPFSTPCQAPKVPRGRRSYLVMVEEPCAGSPSDGPDADSERGTGRGSAAEPKWPLPDIASCASAPGLTFIAS